ncbi:hypothetical protein [Actinophytocola sp.]|uniref:hypothetical protein n=1 Tax=Actinophytocola sp. TaxID=1872138 RepID=UPI002D7EABDB|nr:hypothetical protein [Actinophytocola sp.]HET9138251.1 hypothetical protein [Actinophytocola sp.]
MVVVGLGVLAALVFTIPYLLHWTFYYVGDNPESFVPRWHYYGEVIRGGHWPTMDPGGWYGGNHAAEAAVSLWNPVWAVFFLVTSLFNDLAAAAALVSIAHLALLAMGAYLLCREYGAARLPAVLLGFAVPATGFTLYYEAAGWPSGLSSFVWVTWFWWAARRHSRGLSGPWLPFLFGVLAVTTGNPYATLGVLIVLAGITVELLVARAYRRLAHLVVMGACVGASALLVYVPLLTAMAVSSRQELAAIVNDTFMVPDLGDLAASSGPSYLPSIYNWNGAVLESLPSTYFVWFAIPLIPWLRWRSLRSQARGLISLGAITFVYFVLVLGPSNVWLFRWPIRLIEYFYLGLAALVAVLLSAGLARDHFRERMLGTVGLVGVGAYLSFAVRPEYYTIHLLATFLVLALVVGAILLYRRGRWLAFGAVLLVGTIAVLTYQTARIPVRVEGNPGVEPPRSIERIQSGTELYRGAYLELVYQTPVRTQDQADGQILFGSLTYVSGHESLNRYGGVGFAKFAEALCMDYKGVTCADAYNRLWRPVAGTSDLPLVDALRVETLVLQNKLLPNVVNQTPPAGWRVALRDDLRAVWVREAPLPHPGRVSYASSGTEVRSSESSDRHERVAFRAPAGGGELIFARLAWPGYTATVDGKPVQLRNGAAGLVTITVPPGEHVLELSFVTPGLRLGAVALGIATIIVIGQSILWWRGNRRRRESVSSVEPMPRTGELDPNAEDLATANS